MSFMFWWSLEVKQYLLTEFHLSRGATKDYIIDYNAGEITFNSTYPITSEMRVTVDYQSSTRNYSRFIGYAGSQFKTDKWSFGASVYNESDLKNQPLQQSIGSDQVAILSTAGDDQTLNEFTFSFFRAL